MIARLLQRKVRDLALMFGAAPKRPAPEEISADALELLAFKKTPEERKKRKAAIAEERSAKPGFPKMAGDALGVFVHRQRLLHSLLLARFLQLVEGAPRLRAYSVSISQI